MLDLLAGFVSELRSAGLPVSLTENLDAMEAVQHIPIEDRQAFKYALGATLVKNNAHWRAFETVFEVYFSLRGPEYRIAEGDDDLDEMWREMQEQMREGDGKGAQGGGLDGLTPEELAQLLMQALMNGDQAMMRALARQAVQRFAGMEPGRPVGGTYYLYRTLRNLDLDAMLEKLMEASRQQAGELTALEERLENDEYTDRIEQFKKEIEAEIRRRLVADRGAEAMAKTLRKPLPEDVEFMHASREEMQNLKKALQPLTRKLAARLARKRRHGRKGALDFRSTVRHSLSYGGVPAEPKFKYPRPAKPELMVVADISGSVAAFARFTLMLVYAMQGQFSKVRSFVFIDGIDEVTDYFKGEEDIAQAIHRVNTEADVVWVDGHSDYGHAFEDFWERYGKGIGPKTTVLLLGDARNNYHASQAWVVKEMQQKARHVYWLNPEPRSYWNTGDSIVGDYGTHTDGVFECRNLRQLEAFVEKFGMTAANPNDRQVVPASLLTHVALPVRDLDATLAFYAKYTTLLKIHERRDPITGAPSAWLANERDITTPGSARFVIVLIGGRLNTDITGDIKEEYGFLRSIAHLGISLSTRHEVDQIAAMAKDDGCLLLGPVYTDEVVGYICVITDPDGNNLEFSVEQILG